MTAASWGRLRPADTPWQPIGCGTIAARARLLGGGAAPSVLGLELDAGVCVEFPSPPGPTLMIVTSGDCKVGDEGSYRAGHLRWSPPQAPVCSVEAGSVGVALTVIGLTGTLSCPVAGSSSGERAGSRPSRMKGSMAGHARRVHIDDVASLDFPDAAGRETQPVQLLFTDDPYVLRTRFAPDFVAGEHWHDFDTIYVINAGSMRFGPQEPLYEAGDIRWVRGGHAYGPEHPGPQGVEFYLISLGGPVSLHWADLEPAPRGRLASL